MSVLSPIAPSRTAGAPPEAGASPKRARPLRWAVRIGSLAAAVLSWQLLTANDARVWVRFDQLPTVGEILDNFAQQLGRPEYYQDLTDSLSRILSGFVLAALLGITAGIAIARSRLASDILQPLIEVLPPIPAIALVPIAILLFPTNEQGIIFITFVAAFFPIVVSTRHAARALPTVWEDAIRTMGGGRLRVLWSVVLPGTLPGVFGGLSVGMGVSWICVISAEISPASTASATGPGRRTRLSTTRG